MKQNIHQYILLSALSLALAAGASAARAGGSPSPTAKLTVTINGRGSIIPNDKGMALDINQTYTIKAIPAAGFGFSDWIEAGPTNTVTNTTAKLTFQMVSNLQLTANFLDIQPPTVTITTKKGQGSNAVVAISGTAKDNVGVSNVWCQAGSSGWILASTSDEFTNWTAYLLLSEGSNTVEVYAEDAAGNRSKTNSVTLGDNSAAFAPESLIGTAMRLVATNGNSAMLGFGGSTFSQVDSGGSENGVGIYTYTASGVETAQVATTFTAPPMTVSNSGGDVITLSFTNATSGTWTNLNTNSGSFTLSDASSTAPDSLSGLRLQNANTGSNVYQFTNEIGDGIYTSTDSNGVSSGTYTYSQYSPVLGLFQTIPTNAGNLGMTNYVLLNFVPGSNTYYVETDATNGTDTNSGSFNVSGEATTAYVGPVSLAGLTAAVSEVKPGGARKSWTLSFDASMFGKFALNTNVDSGVGTYTFTRTGPKTALYANDFMAPPQSTNSDGGSEITFYFTGSHSAIVTNSGGRATVTFSEPAGIVPLSLAGKTFTGSAPDHHASGGVSFGNGTFAGVGDLTGVGGNYTYTPFGPQAAMAVLTFTVGNGSGTAAGSTWYIEMWFSSATSGSDINNDFGPDGTLDKVSTGTFTVK